MKTLIYERGQKVFKLLLNKDFKKNTKIPFNLEQQITFMAKTTTGNVVRTCFFSTAPIFIHVQALLTYTKK